MNAGTWAVKGKVKDINVELKLVLIKQNGVIRAVPKESADEIIATATPGKIDKTKVKIGKLKIDKEQLIAALPAGGVKII